MQQVNQVHLKHFFTKAIADLCDCSAWLETRLMPGMNLVLPLAACCALQASASKQFAQLMAMCTAYSAAHLVRLRMYHVMSLITISSLEPSCFTTCT